MKSIGLLENTIQEYAWGSLTAIPKLLGIEPEGGKPRAELWMGAHPKAPSTVICNDSRRTLDELIRQHPKEMLGETVASRFHGQLPYLFKVLAAAKPLSIQAHPSRAQAEAGYRRENEAGIPLDAPDRNYRDANHKPECICALTPFWAMNGFRPFSDILGVFEIIFGQSADFKSEISGLKHLSEEQGLKRFFNWLMTLAPERQQQLVDRAVRYAEPRMPRDPACRWMMTLFEQYPSDIGVLSPLFLNLIRLDPGQAMFLASGELHAYLEGVGIELMANSDNVLRGGLTPKHVDVLELMRVLNFTERDITILSPRSISPCESVYPTPADEFVLSVITIQDGSIFRSAAKRSIEIILCTQGTGQIEETGSGHGFSISRGMSVVVPAAAPVYTIRGNATLYKAAVPI